jgi:uncharacterized protein
VDEETARTQQYALFIVQSHASLITVNSTNREVPSVVWIAPYAGRLLVLAGANSLTVQRIRSNPRAQIAPCNEQGHLVADPIPVTARIMFPEEFPIVPAAMRKKYGWRFWLVNAVSSLVRPLPFGKRVGIELTLA